MAGFLRFVAFMPGHATCYELAMFLVEPRSALGSDLERSAALSRRVPVEVVYGLRLGYQCLLTASAICAANATANNCIHCKGWDDRPLIIYCPA